MTGLVDQGVSVKLFEQLQDAAQFDPVWFAEEILKIEKLDPWQEELLESVCDIERKQLGLETKFNHKGLPYITVRSPHGPGKTFTGALLAHWWQFIREGRVVVTAPKEGQLKTRFFPEFVQIGSNALPGYSSIYKATALRVDWGTERTQFAIGETARTPENLAGYHHDYLLVIVDEASGVDENMFPAIEGALSTGVLACMVLISNPTKQDGTFYASHMRQQVARDYYRMHVDPEKSSRVSKKWLEKMARKYGKNSSIYQIRCLGQFAAASPLQLIALEHIEAARYRDAIPDGSIPYFRLSIDVSDGGSDLSSFAAKRVYETFDHYLRVEKKSYPKITATKMHADDAERIFAEFGGNKETDEIIVDAIGVGAGVRDELIARGYNVIAFKGGSASADTKMWRDKRTQCYIALYNRLLEGRVVFDEAMFTDLEDWDDFEGELCSINRDPTSEKLEAIETKTKMLARGVASPNMADSVMMSYTTDEVATINAGADYAGVIGTQTTGLLQESY